MAEKQTTFSLSVLKTCCSSGLLTERPLLPPLEASLSCTCEVTAEVHLVPQEPSFLVNLNHIISGPQAAGGHRKGGVKLARREDI